MARDSDKKVFEIPLDAIFEAEAGLVNGTFSTSASGYAQFLNVLGINATYASKLGFMKVSLPMMFSKHLPNWSELKSWVDHWKERLVINYPISCYSLQALNQAISDLLSGKIGNSAEDFAKLLKILGIDAATAAEYGLKQGETVLQYIEQIGIIIAAEVAAGLGKFA